MCYRKDLGPLIICGLVCLIVIGLVVGAIYGTVYYEKYAHLQCKEEEDGKP